MQLAVSVALIAASAGRVAAQPQNVDIPAADGTALRATYFSPGRPGPAILLLHQCNMDRHAWDSLAAGLATKGFHVLTFTLRGFSDGATTIPEQPLPQWPTDIETALAYLLAQPGVDKDRVAAGGASCGVEQATNLAIGHPEIRALVLLSGGAAPEGIDYVKATSSVAVFAAAATGDQLAADTRTAVRASRNPKSVLKMYAGVDHGVAMFRAHPELPNAIIQWLQTQVTP